MATTQKEPYAMTASAFSALMGSDRHELTKKLSAINARPSGAKNGGKLYVLRDLVNAHIGGDEKQERIRKLRAESERLEIQNAKTRGELVEVSRVIEAGQKMMAAARAKILAMPITTLEKDSLLADLRGLAEMNFEH